MSDSRIRAIRKSKKISGTKVAKELGISAQHYYDIEKGENGLSAENAVKLAEYFEVSLDYLLGQSLRAVIEDRLRDLNMTKEQLAESEALDGINFLYFFENIDKLKPIPEHFEPGDVLDKIAIALKWNIKDLASKVVLKDNHTENQILSTETPSWATSKDLRDFKKMLLEDTPVMFDGVPLDSEDKEKVLKVMEAIFWDAKKKNKRKPIEE